MTAARSLAEPSMAEAADPVDLSGVARMHDGLSAAFLEHWAVVPIRQTGRRLEVGSWRTQVDEQVLGDLAHMFEAEPEVVPVPREAAVAAIRRAYAPALDSSATLIRSLGHDEHPRSQPADALDDVVAQANEAPVIRLVNLLLLEAIQARASDVHLEQDRAGAHVRYRIDGVLLPAPAPPPRLAPAIVSRLKIMAELDIAERRLPQDGRIRLRLKEREIDVRVSTLPSLHGESVVLRLLDSTRTRIDIDALGMDEPTTRAYLGAANRSHGIVLATGPTGSGKTTTLYATLDRIRTGQEKIVTVEDPAEYELPGSVQVSIQPRIGLTFSAALRAMLRQDPDILLVGEIRDAETAEIACHAALTGHLVLSTLHTNDAPGALIRLLDLGVPPYLVASTVEVVLAQRLVRTTCDACASDKAVDRSECLPLGLDPKDFPAIKRGGGCDACRGTGYRGRCGVYELLVVDDVLRRLVADRPDARRLRRAAIEGGMRTLLDDGVRLVRSGLTTPEEVARVALGGGEGAT